ncbi:MAG: class 1 fructose-bisphosphatase [Haloferacaceae archaeon]
MSGLDDVVGAVHAAASDVRTDLSTRAGGEGGTNPSGEDQIAADVWADEQFFDALSALDSVGEYVSEERAEAVDCGEGYAVAIDPLDGSSNLASNNPVGTIVGVYDAGLPASGRSLVAATMVLYGPYTTSVVAREDTDEVREYLLDDGEVRSRGALALPDDPTVVGIAGKRGERSAACDALVDGLERELKLRYGGAMAADVRQVLEYGGLFGYPAVEGHPDGKLRVHFESAPLAYVLESLGGASTDGEQSLLDVEPTGLHDRTQTFLGNEAVVERVESALGD